MNTQWNAEVVTPVEEGAGTKVLDNQSNVQPTLEAGSNITIANGEISATGGGAEYTAGSGISINENTISVDSDIRSGAAAGATAVQAADLATVATSGSYNDLSNTPTIPAAQVNADWNASSGVAEILNKPALATVATSGSYADLSNKPTIPDAQVNSDWNAASGVSQILNKPNLATVATSGSYDDLTNKPSIPAAQVNADWDAVSGVSQILNKPTIPTVAQSYNALSTDAMSGTAVAEAISGTGQVPSVTSTDNGKVLKATYEGGVGTFGWDAAPSGVPSTTSSDEGKVLGVTDNQGSLGWVSQTPAQVNADWNSSSGVSEILNKPTLATVATSGSYADLSNKPTIPTVDQSYDASSTNAQSGVAVAGAIATKQDTISDLATIRSGAEAGATAVQPGDLATVATSGSYNDLSNKPTIPAAQVNSDWNASSGVSQILNKPTLATVATSGSYADLSNKPTIPTVDQSYSASSTNAQSGVAVANAISAVKQVPASTSVDEGKVLTVNSSGNAVWDAAPATVTIGYKEV